MFNFINMYAALNNQQNNINQQQNITQPLIIIDLNDNSGSSLIVNSQNNSEHSISNSDISSTNVVAMNCWDKNKYYIEKGCMSMETCLEHFSRASCCYVCGCMGIFSCLFVFYMIFRLFILNDRC